MTRRAVMTTSPTRVVNTGLVGLTGLVAVRAMRLVMTAIVSTLVVATGLAAAASTVHAATFSWNTNSLEVAVGQKKSVVVKLDTQGQEATGADLVVSFDPAVVNVNSVNFSAPLLFSQNFFKQQSGVLELHGTHSDVASFFSGNESWAAIELSGVAPGSTSISINCQSGETSDTNVVQRLTAQDIVECQNLGQVAVAVTDSGSSGGTGGSGGSGTSGSGTSGSGASGTTGSGTTGSGTGSSGSGGSGSPGGTSGSSGTGSSSSSGGSGGTGSQIASNQGGTCQTPFSPSLFSAAPTSDPTALLLNWNRSPRADHYSVAFGLEPNAYQWGAANIGDTDQFLINALRPATRYFVGLAAVNNCGSSEFAVASATTSSSSGQGTTGGSISSPPAATPPPGSTTQQSPPPTATPPPPPAQPPQRVPSTSSLLTQQRSTSPSPVQRQDEADVVSQPEDSSKSQLRLVIAAAVIVLLLIRGTAAALFVRGRRQAEHRRQQRQRPAGPTLVPPPPLPSQQQDQPKT